MEQQSPDEVKIIYSVPRHDLAEEFAERFRATSEAPIHVVPQAEYTPRDIIRMDAGLPPQSQDQARSSIIERMQHPDSKGIYVCTHALLACLRDINANMVIADENIEDALTTTVTLGKVGVGGLSGFFGNREDAKQVSDLLDVINAAANNERICLAPLAEAMRRSFDWGAYLAGENILPGIGRISEFDIHPRVCQTQRGPVVRFVIRSSFLQVAERKGIPVKMFSATPQSSLLKHRIGISFKECRFPIAKNAGEIVQFMGITAAKGFRNATVEKNIEYVKAMLSEDIIGSSVLLTYKGHDQAWERLGFTIPRNSGKIVHLQNCSGPDFIKGKSIIVVGKPDYDDDFALRVLSLGGVNDVALSRK